MKLFLAALILFSCEVFAGGPQASDVRMPVGAPAAIDTSSTNITSAAWVQMIASTTYACSAIQVHNSGAQPIKLGQGAAASEIDLGLVLPIGVSILVPVHIAKGTRISLRSMGSTQSSGIITLSCLQ